MAKVIMLWITFISAIAIFIGLSFLIVAGLTWLICFGFGIAFSWRIAVGVFAVYVLLINIANSIRLKQ